MALHKYMTIKQQEHFHSESMSRLEEEAGHAKPQRVCYSYEFIEDHHEKPTRSADKKADTVESYVLSEKEGTPSSNTPQEVASLRLKEEVEEDCIWLIEKEVNEASDDVEEALPPTWGPEGYHSKHHPVALMVSYQRI